MPADWSEEDEAQDDSPAGTGSAGTPVYVPLDSTPVRRKRSRARGVRDDCLGVSADLSGTQCNGRCGTRLLESAGQWKTNVGLAG